MATKLILERRINMKQELLDQIKERGFYTFIRENVTDSDVADIILNYVDLSIGEFYGDEEYDKILNRITDIKEYE